MNTTEVFLECDAEFLSLIINYPELLDSSIVKPEYLHPREKILYEILLQEHKVSKEYIPERLQSYKDFDIVYFAELLSNNLSFYSKNTRFQEIQKVIIDRYKKEKFKEIIDAFDGDCNATLDKLNKVNELSYAENEYIKAKDIYQLLIKKSERIDLGFPSLDKSLNLSQGDLLIIAAGTGVGKTCFALNLLSNLSKDYQCIYFNMEMSKNILYRRLLAINSSITLKDLNDINALNNYQKQTLANIMQELEDRKIILINKTMTVEEMKSSIANVKTDKHIVVFIDHIGLVKAKGNSLYEKMTNVAKDLRAISLNNDCTLIGLSQLSRESQKLNEAPKLQDLRDSGEIEQSARKVLLLYNRSQNKEDRVQDVDVIIAKNDDGDKLIKNFRFDRYTQLFIEGEKQ